MVLQVSNLKRMILGISIAIVLVLFIGYGINTFYDDPEYNDFCTRKAIPTFNESDCLAEGGEWSVYPKPARGVGEELIIEGYCNQDFTCSEEYLVAREEYNKKVFIFAVVAGLIAVILGGAVLHLESVSSGIMGGGVLSIIYGTLRYWGDLGDIWRFIILGIVLAVLIWIGYKKFGK
ncbi:MAG: hypothetical protein O2779_02000 [Nanoarchaeota archaeon]|nr:hypothetical protein [Nanoarchaeota archaeon]